MLEYGLLIGRFQPLHMGHLTIINEIIVDGLKPAILIGSPQDSTPFTSEERAIAILDVIGVNMMMATLPDYPDDASWVDHLSGIINDLSDPQKICIYYSMQHSDTPRDSLTGKHYIDLLKHSLPCKFKEATFPRRLSIDVSSKDINQDIELHKHMLPGVVYQSLKNKLVSNSTFN